MVGTVGVPGALTFASSCAFNAAIAAAAFGSGGGIGLPNLVCNLTTCKRPRIKRRSSVEDLILYFSWRSNQIKNNREHVVFIMVLQRARVIWSSYYFD